MEEIISQTKQTMERCKKKLSNDFNTIRTGRAHPSMLENVMVEVYGQNMKLNTCSSISASDASTLNITVWDAVNIKAIDKALRIPPNNFNPRIEGNSLFLTLPPITTERRDQLIKIVGTKEEEAKVSIRNLRREANQKIKTHCKENNLSEDAEGKASKQVQQLTDSYIELISKQSSDKKNEIKTI